MRALLRKRSIWYVTLAAKSLERSKICSSTQRCCTISWRIFSAVISSFPASHGSSTISSSTSTRPSLLARSVRSSLAIGKRSRGTCDRCTWTRRKRRCSVACVQRGSPRSDS
uniref:(northern house mosquito) hypothetical protein n=1 Tax=Culex pipiens TaxID=7175 RepID=A0A8D8K4W5_CULPI